MQVRWLLRMRQRVPVHVIERIDQGRRLVLFKKYTNRTLFIGKLPVLGILLMGLWGCVFYFNGRFNTVIESELRTIMNHARVDDMGYQVVDFFQKKGQLIIHVANRLGTKPEEKPPMFRGINQC
ncbi:MAG TPA: hypothetical protein VJZ32_03065 [Candidatus Bathyarchaeia archaeon]|nr:hypothetical protein [Candidatus Bathyarchaeia archaeon]